MASSNSSYVWIRDDSSLKSLSKNERNFLRSCALATENDGNGRVLRCDGRGPGDVRKVRLSLGRWHNGAECTVQWGTGTRVTALVTANLMPPVPDRPSEGSVSVSVDLSPMASTSFGHAQPLTTIPGGAAGGGAIPAISDESQKLLSNRILRCLERTLLVGGALDTEALCVQSGSWVWKLNVHVTALDNGGNLVDATVLAAVAALRHYRKPQVDLAAQRDDNAEEGRDGAGSPTLLHSDAREPTPLPLHHTPLSISFALIHSDDAALSTSSTSTVAAIVDPTDREELVQTGSITLAMNIHSEVCLLDFGGGCELRPTQLKQCWKLGQDSILQLCKMLEQTLTDADVKAQQERLDRLHQVVSNLSTSVELPLPDISEDGVPFLAKNAADMIDTTSGLRDVSDDVARAAAQVEQGEEGKAEEVYRLQALDYALGHVAAKVKEGPVSSGKNRQGKMTAANANAMAGSLLDAMLNSAKKSTAQEMEERSSEENPWMPVPAAEGQPPLEQGGTDSLQPQKAKDEFDQFVQNQRQQASETTKKSINRQIAMDDSDEEETTTMLQNEFHSGSSSKGHDDSVKSQPKIEPMEEGDPDDLAMAITTKKKKKKKSKKSK